MTDLTPAMIALMTPEQRAEFGIEQTSTSAAGKYYTPAKVTGEKVIDPSEQSMGWIMAHSDHIGNGNKMVQKTTRNKVKSASILPAESESDFQSWLIEYAQLRGWLVAHFRPALTTRGWRTPVSANGGGFFDLVLARNGIVLFVEVKSEKGKLSLEQKRWFAALSDGISLKVPAYIWRPSMRDSIMQILE